MAAKKRMSTRWRPVTWERTYRCHAVWVEEVYSSAPKWQWSAFALTDFEGRAATRLAAMRAAERAIDATLRPRRKRATPKGGGE